MRWVRQTLSPWLQSWRTESIYSLTEILPLVFYLAARK